MELGAGALPDSSAMYAYINGLKFVTREKVVMERPTTLDDCILCAERAD